MSLIACPACERHIRTTETACPFCSAAVADAIAKAPARVLPAERLSRAAMMAFTAATLGAAACGGDVSSPGPSGNGGEMGVPLYGAPVYTGGAPNAGGTPSAGGSQTAGGAQSAGGEPGSGGMPIVFYGAPFPPPPGGSSNAGGTTGAGGAPSSGGQMAVPAYGAPFPGGAPGAAGSSQGGANGSGDGMGTPIYGAPPVPAAPEGNG